MGEKRMHTCKCNWVTMLYTRKKNCVGEITIKKKKKKVFTKQKRLKDFKTKLMVTKRKKLGGGIN